MGAKTNTQQLSTQTPLQRALMDQQIRAVMAQLGKGPSATLGGTWGGAGTGLPGPGTGLGVPNQGVPTTQNLAGILANGSIGVRDQFTQPFVSPFRRSL